MIVDDCWKILHLRNRNKIIENSHPFYYEILAKPLRELASSLSAKIFFLDSELIPELARYPSYLFSYSLGSRTYGDVVLNPRTLPETQKWLQSDVSTLLNVALAHELGHLIARLDNGDSSENRAWLESIKLLEKYQLCDRQILNKIALKTVEWWAIERC